MIFCREHGPGVGSPPGLASSLTRAFSTYKGRTIPVFRRNVAPSLCIKTFPVKPQVKLESRLTGHRVILTGRFLPLVHAISHIPIMEDVRRIR